MTWSENGVTRSLQSNPITLTVETPPQLTTWTPDPGAPVTELVAAQSCQASGTQAAASVASAGVREALARRDRRPRRADGGAASRAPEANRDPLVAEQLVATITTTGGDRETATLRETGVDTGVFTAALPTTDAVDAPIPGNCVIELGDSDQIQVSVASPRPGTSPILLATVAVLVDPRGRCSTAATGSRSRARACRSSTRTPGDAIVYTVSITNPDPAYVRRDLVVADRLPPGLRLRVGSVRLNGVPPSTGSTIGADGRSLAVG